jgi:hypothetical protein
MDNATCSFQDCPRKSYRRGLCQAHYKQYRLEPELRALEPPLSTRSLAERLDANTLRTDTCWVWTGTVNPRGYGLMGWQKKYHMAHRLAWEASHGLPVPDGLEIDHMCRVRSCVNPEHLQAVTRKLNTENISLARNNTSGSRGVSWDKSKGKWRAYTSHNGRRISAGTYRSKEQAEEAALQLRMRLHTNNLEDRARLNHGQVTR